MLYSSLPSLRVHFEPAFVVTERESPVDGCAIKAHTWWIQSRIHYHLMGSMGDGIDEKGASSSFEDVVHGNSLLLFVRLKCCD